MKTLLQVDKLFSTIFIGLIFLIVLLSFNTHNKTNEIKNLSSQIAQNELQIKKLQDENLTQRKEYDRVTNLIIETPEEAEPTIPECETADIDQQFLDNHKNKQMIDVQKATIINGKNCKISSLSEYLSNRLSSKRKDLYLDKSIYYNDDKYFISYKVNETLTLAEYEVSTNQINEIKKVDEMLEIKDIKFLDSSLQVFDPDMDSLFFRIDVITTGCIDDAACDIFMKTIDRVCSLNQAGTWYYDISTKKLQRVSSNSNVCKLKNS
jgi:hypothetical protein